MKVQQTKSGFRRITIGLLTILAMSASCDDKDIKPTTLELLTSSTWIGITEVVRIEADLYGNVKNESTEVPADNDYRQIVLQPDRIAIATYQCTTTSCTGEEYQGTWSMIEDHLTVTLHGEQFNSIGDLTLIDAEIFRIDATEMILQTINNGHTSWDTKVINRLKFIRK